MPPEQRLQQTQVERQGTQVTIRVGDSRQGWVQAYQALLELASEPVEGGVWQVTVEVSHVRPQGEPLKGFGGLPTRPCCHRCFPGWRAFSIRRWVVS